MMQMVGAFAEFERAMLRERTKAGLDAARKQGRIGGVVRSSDLINRKKSFRWYQRAPKLQLMPHGFSMFIRRQWREFCLTRVPALSEYKRDAELRPRLWYFSPNPFFNTGIKWVVALKVSCFWSFIIARITREPVRALTVTRQSNRQLFNYLRLSKTIPIL